MKLVPEDFSLPRLLGLAALPFFVGALLLARLAPGQVLAFTHCPLREATGVPCPTCGATLALTRLAAGQWADAAAANPLVSVAAGAGLLLMLGAAAATLVPRWRLALRLDPGEKKNARWLAVILIVLNWAWLLWRAAGRAA